MTVTRRNPLATLCVGETPRENTAADGRWNCRPVVHRVESTGQSAGRPTCGGFRLAGARHSENKTIPNIVAKYCNTYYVRQYKVVLVQQSGGMSKLTDMASAISAAVSDGQQLYLGGFTHLIPFAAGHEVIRQGITDLDIVRPTPDLVVDRMVAAGSASKLTFSWAGNPGVGSLRAFRRAVEDEVPNPVEVDEYTHFGLVARLTAGAQNLPFMPVRTFAGSSLPAVNENIKPVEDPFGGDSVYAVPPLTPDVAVVRAQRADREGNAHLWGILGEIVEAAFAADTVILSVEELVDGDVIRSDPNRTAIPGIVVDHVVEEPYGSHPSYAQGYYDRDNDAYLEWDDVSRTHESTMAWIDDWVYGCRDHREYVERLGAGRLLDLQPRGDFAEPVNMGRYT